MKNIFLSVLCLVSLSLVAGCNKGRQRPVKVAYNDINESQFAENKTIESFEEEQEKVVKF